MRWAVYVNWVAIALNAFSVGINVAVNNWEWAIISLLCIVLNALTLRSIAISSNRG